MRVADYFECIYNNINKRVSICLWLWITLEFFKACFCYLRPQHSSHLWESPTLKEGMVRVFMIIKSRGELHHLPPYTRSPFECMAFFVVCSISKSSQAHMYNTFFLHDFINNYHFLFFHATTKLYKGKRLTS